MEIKSTLKNSDKNYETLNYIESLLNPDDFKEVWNKLEPKMEFGTYYDWQGNLVPQTYEDLKRKRGNFVKEEPGETSLMKHKMGLMTGKEDLESSYTMIQQKIKMFQRTKTIFGHVIIPDEAVVVSCLEIDPTGRLLITAGDDKCIKLWSLINGSLQGILHGHQDVIIDMCLSKSSKRQSYWESNTLLISADKNGHTIVWDIKDQKQLFECQDHTGQINNLKVTQMRLSNKVQQIMYSCGDDGIINIYALDNIRTWEETHSKPGRALRQVRQETLSPLIMSIDTQESGYGKIKKMQAISMSDNGLVFGGCLDGSLYVYRLFFKSNTYSYQLFQNTLVTCVKVHKKNIHLIDVSPDGEYLITGSIDGSAKIWKIPTNQDLKDFSYAFKDIQGRVDKSTMSPFMRNLVKSIELPDSDQIHRQCESLCWTVNGRYAAVSIGSKLIDDDGVIFTVILIWDQLKRKIVHKLGDKGNKYNLNYSTSLLEPHPTMDSIVLSGGSKGRIVIWNIQQGRAIKTFLETGVYARDHNVLSEIFEGKWSACGNYFSISTMIGTISLYSCYETDQYVSTPIEQFFHLDQEADTTFDTYNNVVPQLCDLERNQYGQQPPIPMIGTQRESKRMTPQHYMRSYNERYRAFKQHHDFILAQEAQAIEAHPEWQDDQFKLDEERDDDAPPATHVRPFWPIGGRSYSMDMDENMLQDHFHFSQSMQQQFNQFDENRSAMEDRPQTRRRRQRDQDDVDMEDEDDDFISDEEYIVQSRRERRVRGDDGTWVIQPQREEDRERDIRERERRLERRNQRATEEVKDGRGRRRRRRRVLSDDEGEGEIDQNETEVAEIEQSVTLEEGSDVQEVDMGAEEALKELLPQLIDYKQKHLEEELVAEEQSQKEEELKEHDRPQRESRRTPLSRRMTRSFIKDRTTPQYKKNQELIQEADEQSDLEWPDFKPTPQMMEPMNEHQTSYTQSYEDDLYMDQPIDLTSEPKMCAFCNLSAQEGSNLLGPFRYKAGPQHSERRNLQTQMLQASEGTVCEEIKYDQTKGDDVVMMMNKNMEYWFHFECLDRNDIVKKIYEFPQEGDTANQRQARSVQPSNPNRRRSTRRVQPTNDEEGKEEAEPKPVSFRFCFIKRAYTSLVLNAGLPCKRCAKPTGATISCSKCGDSYHGYKCSEVRMTYNRKGKLICLDCLDDEVATIPSDYYDQISQLIYEQQVFRKIDRYFFKMIEVNKDIYVPQIDDLVYFIPQAYEDLIKDMPYHFIEVPYQSATHPDSQTSSLRQYIIDSQGGHQIKYGFGYGQYRKVGAGQQGGLKPKLYRVTNMFYDFPSIQTFEYCRKLGQLGQIVTYITLQEEQMQVSEHEGGSGLGPGGWQSDGIVKHAQTEYTIDYSSDTGFHTQGNDQANPLLSGLVKLNPKKPEVKPQNEPKSFTITYLSQYRSGQGCLVKKEIYEEAVGKVINVAHDSIINQTQNGDAKLLRQFVLQSKSKMEIFDQLLDTQVKSKITGEELFITGVSEYEPDLYSNSDLKIRDILLYQEKSGFVNGCHWYKCLKYTKAKRQRGQSYIAPELRDIIPAQGRISPWEIDIIHELPEQYQLTLQDLTQLANMIDQQIEYPGIENPEEHMKQDGTTEQPKDLRAEIDDFKIKIMPVDTPPYEGSENEADVLVKKPVKKEKKGESQWVAWYEGIPVSQSKVLINTIKKYMKDHQQLVLPFQKYMNKDVAPDYFDVIAVESNLELIIQRLENNYYRSIDQCYFEIELLGYNSIQFNGITSSYSQDAQHIVKQLLKILCKKKPRKYTCNTINPMLAPLQDSQDSIPNINTRPYQATGLRNQPDTQESSPPPVLFNPSVNVKINRTRKTASIILLKDEVSITGEMMVERFKKPLRPQKRPNRSRSSSRSQTEGSGSSPARGGSTRGRGRGRGRGGRGGRASVSYDSEPSPPMVTPEGNQRPTRRRQQKIDTKEEVDMSETKPTRRSGRAQRNTPPPADPSPPNTRKRGRPKKNTEQVDSQPSTSRGQVRKSLTMEGTIGVRKPSPNKKKEAIKVISGIGESGESQFINTPHPRAVKRTRARSKPKSKKHYIRDIDKADDEGSYDFNDGESSKNLKDEEEELILHIEQKEGIKEEPVYETRRTRSRRR